MKKSDSPGPPGGIPTLAAAVVVTVVAFVNALFVGLAPSTQWGLAAASWGCGLVTLLFLQRASGRRRPELHRLVRRSEWDDEIEATFRGTRKQIDLLGLSLRSTFFKRHSAFVEFLESRDGSGQPLNVRVCICGPDSMTASQREVAERQTPGDHLRAAIMESLETIRSIVDAPARSSSTKLSTVLVDDIAITHSIMRFDDVMFVTFYRQHGTGRESPTIRLMNGDPWFKAFADEFDRTFDTHLHTRFPH